MATWTPDPSFYPSPRMAMKAAPETLAYVAAFDPTATVPDELAVVDVDPKSATYGQIVHSLPMPHTGDELHHFGWNACSSCLCPNAPHPHMERRYLVVPGLKSSRIHIVDTKPDARRPTITRVIEPGEVAELDPPTRGAHLGDIAVGPDGAVWFLEMQANKIGRFAANRFTEFPLPARSAGLTAAQRR